MAYFSLQIFRNRYLWAVLNQGTMFGSQFCSLVGCRCRLLTCFWTPLLWLFQVKYDFPVWADAPPNPQCNNQQQLWLSFNHLSHFSSTKAKHSLFPACEHVRICCFSVSYCCKLDMFELWNIGLAKKAIWIHDFGLWESIFPNFMTY